jgi:multidrug efflux system outer membrane protein
MNNSIINYVNARLALWRMVPLTVMLTLAGCVALPPADKAPALLQPTAADFAPGNAGAWPAPTWWQQFGDTQLNTLEDLALRNSPSMAVVQARVAQANATIGEVAASSGINLAADASVTRELYAAYSYYPPPIAGNTLNSGTLLLNFSYDFDWWGRHRSMLAGALGRRAAADAEAAAAASSLSTAVADVYFQWQTVSHRVQLQRDIEAQRMHLVELEGRRVKAGISSGDNLTPLQAEAAAPHQTRVQLETQRDQLYFQLKTLVGSAGFPAELQSQGLPQAATALPPALPLDLLARRADIAASRERVQASLHDVEAARAAFYPDINLSAFIGLTSLEMSQLLHASSLTHGITPALHLPIFDAGRLRAELNAERAEAGLAVAQYDQSVQTAVGEVNDAAVKLNGAIREQAALTEQLSARQRDLDSAQRRVRTGLADGREVARDRLLLLVLNDQELVRQQHSLSAQVDLIKALGGGYQTPAGADVSQK